MTPRRDRTIQRIEWLVSNVRWLMLAVAALLLFLRTELDIGFDFSLTVPIGLLAVTVLYNIVLVLFEFFEFWHPWLPWLSLTIDTVLAIGLFLASGGVQGPLVWIGLFPAFTAALRHRAFIGMGLIISFSLAQATLIGMLNPSPGPELIVIGVSAAFLWPLTAGAAFIGLQVRSFLQSVVRQEYMARQKQAQNLRKHARAIYDMASTVSATLDYTRVLDAALNYGALGAEGRPKTASEMVGVVLLFEEDRLRVSTSWRLPPADNRVICPAREGVLATVIRTGDPLVSAHPSQDPELQQFIGLRGCHSIMALPLRVGFETYGVVLYGHPQEEFFDDDQRAFFAAMVDQAIIAMQNAQLYRNLQKEKERLVEVQEEANKKLARDLHDGPTQSVAALAMRANFARRLLERDAKAASEELFKMEDLARRTTKEIRHMLFTLRPLVLENQGLTAALKQLAEKMRDTHSQNVLVEVDGSLEDQLEKNQQGVLFYIAEEAVNNARKHAQAEHVWVRLKVQQEILVLEIQDDGVGFNVGAMQDGYERRGSLGMVNMRERAEILSGAVKIDSEEGRGTRITVLVPLKSG